MMRSFSLQVGGLKLDIVSRVSRSLPAAPGFVDTRCACGGATMQNGFLHSTECELWRRAHYPETSPV